MIIACFSEVIAADGSGGVIDRYVSHKNTHDSKYFGLKPEAVSIVEDGQTLPVDTLNEIAVPLQLVIGVNQGAPLDTRDPSTNFSHFQRISQILVQWAESRPADLPDDYSIVSQAGPVINHAGAAEFALMTRQTLMPAHFRVG